MDKMIMILISVAIVLGILGIIILVYSIIGLFKKRIKIWKIPPYFITFIIFMALGAALFFLGMFLQTFSRYTAEEKVGWVYAEQSNSEISMKYYEIKSDSLHQFVIYGDQWMIEGKFIRWNLILRFLGKGAFYKVVRFSGRWDDGGPYSIYDFEGNKGMWKYILKYYKDIPLIDAAYGIGAFQYATGDTFYVYINDTGFILRRQ